MNHGHEGGELGAEARALIAIGAAGDEPSAADRARGRTRLLAAIGASAVGGAATLAAAKTSAASQLGGVAGHAAGAAGLLGGKVGVSVLVTALVVTGGYAGMRALHAHGSKRDDAPRTMAVSAPAQMTRSTQGEPPMAAPARVRSTRPAAAALPAAEPTAAAPHGSDVIAPEATPAAEPVIAPQTLAAATPSSARRSPARARAQRRAIERARFAAPSGSGGLPQTTSAAPATASPEPTTPRAAEPATVAAKPEAALAPSLRRELALIAAAQSSLAQNEPGQALRLLDQHAESFATGSLAQERLAARAVALCTLQRMAEGRRATMDLARLAPSSPLLGRARRACGASTP